MANNPLRLGPVAVTTSVTNLFNPPTTTGGVNGGTPTLNAYVSHIRITNKTSAAATISLWLGATGASAAGTELCVNKNVPANDWVDLWYTGKPLKITSSDFITMQAGTTTALVATAEYELAVVS